MCLRDGSCGSGDHPSDHDAQFGYAELVTDFRSSTFAFVLRRSLVAGQLSVQLKTGRYEMATRLQWWRDRLRDPEWMLALATIALGVIAFAFYFTILWISMPVATGYIGPALRGLPSVF